MNASVISNISARECVGGVAVERTNASITSGSVGTFSLVTVHSETASARPFSSGNHSAMASASEGSKRAVVVLRVIASISVQNDHQYRAKDREHEQHDQETRQGYPWNQPAHLLSRAFFEPSCSALSLILRRAILVVPVRRKLA